MQLRSRPIAARNGHSLPKIDTQVTKNGASDIVVEQDGVPEKPPYLSRKTLALVLLVLQNASVSLLTRLSRTPRPGQLPYTPAVAVFVAELMKVSLSMTMLIREKMDKRSRERKKEAKPANGSTGASNGVRKSTEKDAGVIGTGVEAVVHLFKNQREEIVKLSVPAALYAIQNTLLYTALTNLDAATYQTTYQLKLLTAAFFSILFFKRSLSPTKWFALFLLTIGVAIVQLDGIGDRGKGRVDQGGSNPRVGLAAILAACVSSGLAGGWFEYVLKSPSAPPPPPPTTTTNGTANGVSSPISKTPSTSSPTSATSAASSPSSSTSSSTSSHRRSSLQLRANSPSLWERNLQLSVPSLFFSFSGVLLSNSSRSQDWWQLKEILQGFTPLVWSVVLNQAMGGLLVALVVREADGVAKGFATSIAIVLSTLASIIFFGLVPGPLFIGGAFLVIASTIIYAADG